MPRMERLSRYAWEGGGWVMEVGIGMEGYGMRWEGRGNAGSER